MPLPFELVFKRGGTSPKVVKTRHDSKRAAEQEAVREYRRQRAADGENVWLAYEILDHSQRRKRVADVTLQRPS